MSTLYRGLRLTTPPAAEPVLWADLPSHLRMDTGETERAYLEFLIAACREEAERYMRRALITQSWTLTLDTWPGGSGDWWHELHHPTDVPSDLYLEMPYPPLRSITSINTYDTDDVATVITVADVFYVDTNCEPGRIVLRKGQIWPVDTRRGARIEIIYQAGYGATGANVPAMIRLGILEHVQWMHEHRGDEVSIGNGLYKSGAAQRYGGERILSL